MNNYNLTIPNNILERAKKIGTEQGFLPLSPYSVDAESKVALCAAACLAYAGLENISKQTADGFVAALIMDLSDTALYEAFDQLNWPTAVCEHVRIENDKSSPDVRLSKFLSTCTKLQERNTFDKNV